MLSSPSLPFPRQCRNVHFFSSPSPSILSIPHSSRLESISRFALVLLSPPLSLRVRRLVRRRRRKRERDSIPSPQEGRRKVSPLLLFCGSRRGFLINAAGKRERKADK